MQLPLTWWLHSYIVTVVVLGPQVVTADTFSPVINALLDERDLGLLLSAVTLLQGVCARYGSGACCARAVRDGRRWLHPVRSSSSTGVMLAAAVAAGCQQQHPQVVTCNL